jgi:hypothetical protein
MRYGSKTWVPLISVTRYISYAPALVARQLSGMQYVPWTLGLANFTGLFKHQPFLEEIKLIQQDWERPLMVKKRKKEADLNHHSARIIQFGEIKSFLKL